MSPLDALVLGLPLHPLVVHLVVVALPVGACATLAAVLSPGFRARYGLPSLGTLTVGALSSVAAKFSGEALAETVPLPERHATLGQALVIASLATTVVAWLWWFLERRREQAPPGRSSLAAMGAGALTVTACLGVAVLTAFTGHAGADATWGSGRAQPAPAASGAEPQQRYTLAEVARHADASSCWVVVDGAVHDLTPWAGAHPGGPQRILGLCGTDASERFGAQHGESARPNAMLERFRIGTLEG